MSKDSSDESCCEVASAQRKRQRTLEANSEAKGGHGGPATHQAGTEEHFSGKAETGETPDIDVEVLPEDRTARPDGCLASVAFRFLGGFESNPPVQIQENKGIAIIKRRAIDFIVLGSRGHRDTGASKASDQENDRLLHRAYAHAVGRWQAGHQSTCLLSFSFKVFVNHVKHSIVFNSSIHFSFVVTSLNSFGTWHYLQASRRGKGQLRLSARRESSVGSAVKGSAVLQRC